jgi:hypothetical protein
LGTDGQPFGMEKLQFGHVGLGRTSTTSDTDAAYHHAQ